MSTAKEAFLIGHLLFQNHFSPYEAEVMMVRRTRRSCLKEMLHLKTASG